MRVASHLRGAAAPSEPAARRRRRAALRRSTLRSTSASHVVVLGASVGVGDDFVHFLGIEGIRLLCDLHYPTPGTTVFIHELWGLLGNGADRQQRGAVVDQA